MGSDLVQAIGGRSDNGSDQDGLRVLYVVHLLPYIPSAGGLTRTFHLIRAAANTADVTLVVADPRSLPATSDDAGRFCRDVHYVSPPVVSASNGRTVPLLSQFRGLLDIVTRDDPFPEGAFNRHDLQHVVRRLLQAEHYDVVVVEHTGLAYALKDVMQQWNGASIAALQDVLSVLEQRRQQAYKQEIGRKRPSLSGWQLVRQLRMVERSLLRSFTRVIAVSNIDAGHLQRLVPSKKVAVVPNGVDVDYFEAYGDSAQRKVDKDAIVFIGSLWYRPNIDAVRYFMSEIWPLIRARRPHTRFLIVGASPTPEILALGKHDGVEVHADVPDVRPYLAQSALAIVPLRLGSGTRLKILEALAAGRAVVSTTLGAEGLELEPGRDLVVADAPEAFAGAVVRLLEQPEEAERLARQGQQTVCERYSWSTIAQQFQILLRDVAQDQRTHSHLIPRV